MNKIFSIFAVVCLCVAVKAVEYDVTFDKKAPAGISLQGTVQQENGVSVLVNDKNYWVGIIGFNGEDAAGTLELELAGTGEPAAQLGIILFQNENGKLKNIKMAAWMRKLAKDKFEKLTFNFPAGTIKAGNKYQIYLYRSNQKGTMKLKRIAFKNAAVKK